jgi:hypothetical protein
MGKGDGRWEEVAKTMYIYVSKCKNGKTKERKNKNKLTLLVSMLFTKMHAF